MGLVPRRQLSDAEIVRAVARVAAERITRRTIRELQKLKDTLSGEGSELETIWDEICVQLQYEESFSWDAYDETVRANINFHVAQLLQHEREAIWLQTDEGQEWESENPEDREANPVFQDDIVDYLLREYVYAEAGNWSNPRIRAYLDRATMRD